MSDTADGLLNYILIDGLVLIAVNVCLWLTSIYLNKTWPVDVIWSNYPIYRCLATYIRPLGRLGNQDRQTMVICLIVIWGLRLTHNFISRGGIGDEDWRYADQRKAIGPRWFWLVSLVSVFLAQSLFLFGATLPIHGAVTNPSAITCVDWIAFGVTLSSILLETVSDLQMNHFISSKREKRTDEVIMNTGLWSLSRHPNYLGEIFFWWGLFLFAASSNDDDDDPNRFRWWVALGPTGVTLLIAFISIKLMEDRQLERKGNDYVRYRRRVGSSLLPLPPFLNGLLGRWLYGSEEEDELEDG